MGRLIALDLAGGPDFVDALRAAWDDGDAVLPVDRRLPEPARRRLLEQARPHVLHDGDGRHEVDPTAPQTADGDALVIASSGTTGTPKLIVHTRDGLLAHARSVHRHLGVTGSDRWLACLPLAHIGGLGVVLRSVLDDVAVDVIDGFDPVVVASAPRRLGTTLVSLVPTALDRIGADGFRWIVLGGSADPVERPANVVRTYGSTETGGGIVYGDTALPGVEIDLSPDGEILVRGPMLARGLRSTSGEVRPITDDAGWFRTGDLGRLVGGQGPGVGGVGDGDGRSVRRLIVDGRSDDLIVTGGQNVWPEPVEAIIRDLPGVAEVAVFGRSDPEWGHRVVAAIVAEGTAPDLETVRGRVREELPGYAAPREIEIVTDLPRTALGKIRRRVLADRSEAQSRRPGGTEEALRRGS